MALVGNGAELEADEVLAGGGVWALRLDPAGMANVPPPWSQCGPGSLPPGGMGRSAKGALSPRERGGSRCRGSGCRRLGVVWMGDTWSGRPVDGCAGAGPTARS